MTFEIDVKFKFQFNQVLSKPSRIPSFTLVYICFHITMAR